MPSAEAQALRIRDTAGFLKYMHQVRARTDAFLDTWDPADYGTRILLKPVGEMTKMISSEFSPAKRFPREMARPRTSGPGA